MSGDSAPLIVSALFGASDFGWLDGLRRAHFPPERNQLAAHLTLFHHLPPSIEAELRQRLSEAALGAPPAADAIGLMNLGRGVAIRINSPALSAIRGELAEAFAGLLTPQDAAGWRPHVTIQNKVLPHEAKALHAALDSGFVSRPVKIEGLAVWRYRGGPWEPLSRHKFRG
ncbi:2'-5' RNA ligase family protein [Sphingomonas sp. ASY06-1R]|uniref:2'-5' RNA ligase family protein n=1 Tax=Sphingomonas sp. ASY06-1R TaxID=3445771 RepID=UPI003FA29D1C